MKASKVSLMALILIITQFAGAQIDLRDDAYILRSDTGLDYQLHVRNNDTPSSSIRIYETLKIGGSSGLYTLNIIDSNYISIKSNGSDTFSGSFTYKGRNSAGIIDSATVTFKREPIAPTVRPGDANLDNSSNHLDIFPLGIHYLRSGSPRHNLDTNINFTILKPAGDWLSSVQSINAKHSDITGNGIVDINDFEKLKLNIGNSAGVYNPRLSDTNGLNQIRFNIADTIIIKSSDSNKIKIPIEIINSNNQLSYGLGFSMSVQYRDNNTFIDSFYSKYSYAPVNGFNLWNNSNQNILFIEDRKSRANHTNIAYCKTNGINENVGNAGGIIEIIAEEILWGITKPTDFARLRVNLKDIAYIDNAYNTIPIKPVSKYVYLTKASAALENHSYGHIRVYPTIITQEFILEKNQIYLENFYVYNTLGQLIEQGQTTDLKTNVSTILWPKGIYYIRLENSGSIYKLIKQ